MIGKTTRVIFFSFFAFKKRKKTTGKVTRRLFASLFRASLSFKKQPDIFASVSPLQIADFLFTFGSSQSDRSCVAYGSVKEEPAVLH
jgi:hypothetical protein